MKKSCVLIALLAFLAPTLIHAQAAPKADTAAAEEMVGTWRLFPRSDGHEEGTDTGPNAAVRLQLSLDAGKLTGTAIIPVRKGEMRWPIVKAAFDGHTFTFTIGSDTGPLSGKMKRVDGKKFEGSWITYNGEEGARLSMTRAEQ